MQIPKWFDIDAWKYGTLGQAILITLGILVFVGTIFAFILIWT